MKVNAKRWFGFFILSRWLLLCGCSGTLKAPAIELLPARARVERQMILGEMKRLYPIVRYETTGKNVCGYMVRYWRLDGELIVEKDMGWRHDEVVKIAPVVFEVRAYDVNYRLSKPTRITIE